MCPGVGSSQFQAVIQPPRHIGLEGIVIGHGVGLDQLQRACREVRIRRHAGGRVEQVQRLHVDQVPAQRSDVAGLHDRLAVELPLQVQIVLVAERRSKVRGIVDRGAAERRHGR